MIDLRCKNIVDVHSIVLGCSNSYLHYHQSKYYQPFTSYLTTLIGDMNTGRMSNVVKWFVTNTARALHNRGFGWRVSLDKNYYSGNKAKIGYKNVIKLLAFLEEMGYITVYKGYVSSWKSIYNGLTPEYVIGSYVVLHSQLIDKFHQLADKNMNVKWDELDVVEIRNRETGEVMSNKGKKGVVEQRVKMQNYNNSLKDADIKYRGNPVCTVEYKRIFLDTMDIAGRLYVDGGGVQILEQRLRSEHLTIDDEPVVELDYHAIHPSILYQYLLWDGCNAYDLLGSDFSPYGADMSFVPIVQEEVDKQSKLLGKKYNPLRNLVKLAILIGINSVDRSQAVGAMAGKVREDLFKEQEDKLFAGVVTPIPVGRILDAVIEHNDLVRQHFYNDKGVFLQRVDSDIIMKVVEIMVQKGHSVLCYHDSVLTKQSAEEDLRKAMFAAWESYFGNTVFCKVDKK